MLSLVSPSVEWAAGAPRFDSANAETLMSAQSEKLEHPLVLLVVVRKLSVRPSVTAGRVMESRVGLPVSRSAVAQSSQIQFDACPCLAWRKLPLATLVCRRRRGGPPVTGGKGHGRALSTSAADVAHQPHLQVGCCVSAPEAQLGAIMPQSANPQLSFPSTAGSHRGRIGRPHMGQTRAKSSRTRRELFDFGLHLI